MAHAHGFRRTPHTGLAPRLRRPRAVAITIALFASLPALVGVSWWVLANHRILLLPLAVWVLVIVLVMSGDILDGRRSRA